MKTEDVGKAIDLLYEYQQIDELLKKSNKTMADVAVLFNNIRNTNIDAEQFEYRREIVNSIQKLISCQCRTGYEFKLDVLMYGIGIATTKLEYKLKELKCKIEKL